jgi:hypothetical protein
MADVSGLNVVFDGLIKSPDPQGVPECIACFSNF